MKTAELIKQLQEADPSGELEVTIGKTDIHFLEVLPGYYDGCYQVLMRGDDPESYNVVGAEIRSKGQHVCLNETSIKSALWNFPDLPVTFDSECAEQKYGKAVEEWRAFGNEMKAKYRTKPASGA